MIKRQWLPLLCLVLALVFSALGLWQLQRLAWKAALIERVQRNTIADPLPIDKVDRLSNLKPLDDEYRRVKLRGMANCDKAVPVWAATALGTGYWWMVPVRLADNGWIWVNQGYVTADAVRPWWSTQPSQKPRFQTVEGVCGQVEIEGLLRATQIGGGFLRKNDAVNGRWYSRDIAALSADRRLIGADGSVVADWFVDAWPKAGTQSDNTIAPVPGLTPLNWPNRHLGYALTWFTLALACIAAAVLSRRPKM